MTLVYRTVWDDDWANPTALLEDEFKKWCAGKGIDADDIPVRGRYAQSDQLFIDVRRADVEFGRALRCTLVEIDPTGRTWTTTATALADNSSSREKGQVTEDGQGERVFWVDLECEDPSGGAPEMAAPRLVRGLIDNGGRPTIFGQKVTTEARRLHHTNIAELTSALVDPNRTIPIVVFSPDIHREPMVTIDRADAAARTLVGLVPVYTISPSASDVLNADLPAGFGVFGGAVRLYLPHLQADDPDDARRHRWIARRIIEAHPLRAASLLAGRLARLQIHRPIPASWDRLGGLLQRPSDSEVQQRAAAIAAGRRPVPDDDTPADLRREVEELTSLLAEADLVREASDRSAGEEIARLQAAIATADEDRLDDADELDQLRRESDELRRTIWILSRPSTEEPAGTEELAAVAEVAVPESISDAVVLASEHLSFVVVPDTALVDVDELDSAEKYLVWASACWQGLRALNDFAEAKNRGEQPAGFKLWCDSTGAWPTSKLAMTESDSVMNSDQMRNQRNFPVDERVDPSGRIFMFAHLKIQAGGGNNIPRLYFHDDTNGPTAQMHVGFIGPHRHVRNTRS